jgi:hypothetical protein
MTMKNLLLAAALVMIATPALADEFYIVRNPTTKVCTITERRPTGPDVVIGSPFGVRVEAERHMKTVKECTETTGSGGRDVEIKERRQ